MVITTLEFPGVSQELYDAVGQSLASYGAPVGIMHHACGPVDGGWRIVDIWESQAAFDRFVDERYLSAMRAAGGPEPSRREAIEAYHAGSVSR